MNSPKAVAIVSNIHIYRCMSGSNNRGTSAPGPSVLSALRTPSLRSDDATSPQPRKLEVVSKQATKVTALSTKLEWKIDQFEKLMKLFKNGQNLISKQFGCPQAAIVTWELHVYPNGKREEDVNNVSFFLRQVGLCRGEDPIMTEFQIYALDSANARVSVCRDTKDFTNQQGRGKFQVSRDKMSNALRADGSLLLICEVEYFPPGSKMSVEAAEEDECCGADESEERQEVNIRRSLCEMWTSELFTDCVIKVGNKQIKAHRCILGQHSDVFKSMFQNEMLEAKEGVIDILDCKYEPMRAMLEFMYTGSFVAAETCAEEVLPIADKYAVMLLKEQCERYLAQSVKQTNVAAVAIFADTYSASILKQACIRFLVNHHKSVIRSPEWRQLKKERHELATELLESVLASGGSNLDSSMDDSDGTSTLIRSPMRKRMRRSGPLPIAQPSAQTGR